MEFVDSHCHLDDEQFKDDRDEVILRARAAGLKYALSIGTGNGPPDLTVAVRLAEVHSFVYATVGIHPNDAGKVNENTFADLESLLQHRKVKAMGEIGLDYHWGVPKQTQLPVFERQLELAKQARAPIVIHTRDAWEDTLNILRHEWAPTDLPCVMHCFTGGPEEARACLELGFFLSYGGVTTFPKAMEVREAAGITPLDRLLLETDCPYLAPVPHRGKRNEPAFLLNTADAIARVRGITTAELAEHTTRNFEQLFRIDDQDAAQSPSYT